jgi:hypothetical protein
MVISAIFFCVPEGIHSNIILFNYSLLNHTDYQLVITYKDKKKLRKMKAC